jgi:glycosyltransferase involved in cell wall biosynthesis
VSSARSDLRIVIAADTFPPDVNGAARFGCQLATGLAGRGHDVHVICPSDSGPASTAVVDGVTVHRVAARRTPFHPTFRIALPWQLRAAELVAELDPDLVHVQAHFVVGRAVLRAARDRGVPVVATNHFMPENLYGHLRVPAPLRRAAARWAWQDLNRVFGAAQVVTAPTPTAVAMLRERGGLPQATAVSCGVDSRFGAVQALTAGPPTVLFVGRLDEEKRVDELLRAVPALPATVRVEIVGDGSRRPALTGLAERLGIADRVRFHGFVTESELIAAYARCTVFCMPGVAELQSLATMEAMSAGKPVVAADAVALPHLVRPGRNGWLYPPGDVAALAARLADVLTDPLTGEAMGAASRELIARHSLDASLDTFEALYAEARHVPVPALVAA